MAKREAVTESLQTIVDQADRLGGMISRLLDVSRAQMGTMELDRQQCDLLGLITSTLEDMQRVTDRHRLVFDTSEPELQGHWDRNYLQQVLVNLVENAIKYSPGGGEITVTVRCENERAVVSIKDQGMGMGQETLAQLFHRFYRSPQARGLGVRGLGVGLYITHQIVTAHDGHIWANSEPGQGSTFTFTLPLH
jgi:signal transduction histidine kinase